MTKFHVTVSDRIFKTYLVEAVDEEEAEEMVLDNTDLAFGNDADFQVIRQGSGSGSFQVETEEVTE